MKQGTLYDNFPPWSFAITNNVIITLRDFKKIFYAASLHNIYFSQLYSEEDYIKNIPANIERYCYFNLYSIQSETMSAAEIFKDAIVT